MERLLLVETLRKFKTIVPKKQDHSQATYAPLIQKQTGRIDWNKPAKTVENLVRGCVSWPIAHTSFRQKPLKIWRASTMDIETSSKPGEVIRLRPLPVVATADGAIQLEEVQLPNKRRSRADSLVNGARLALGEILGE